MIFFINKQKSKQMSNENKPVNEGMKPKSGTAKPSGKIGKGGDKTSPTDGGSLKPGGKKQTMKKGGPVKK